MRPAFAGMTKWELRNSLLKGKFSGFIREFNAATNRM